MRTTKMSRLIGFSFLTISIAACTQVADPDPTPARGTVSPQLVTASRVDPRIVSNNRSAAIEVAGAPIAMGGVDQDPHRLIAGPAANAMAAGDDSRELLSLLVACALPASITLIASTGGSTGDEIEILGEVGIAPQWTHRPLDRDGMAWVSACVFSRLSGSNVEIPISLRGANPALVSSPDELDTWTVEEGAFFGDVFTPLDRPIEWIACQGAGSDSGSGQLLDRTCTKVDPNHPGLTMCGFFLAGRCVDVCERGRGSYRSCEFNGRRHRDVVTAFVTP